MAKDRRRAGWLAACMCWLCAAAVPADTLTLVLKNGARGAGTSFRREGDRILFVREMRGPDGTVSQVESGVAVAEIEKVESEMPKVLKNAPALLAAGKAASVLPEVAAAAKGAEPLGDLPGNWWPQIVTLQAQTLVALGQGPEATAVAAVMERSGNAALAHEGKALLALLAARKGDHDTAAQLASPLWKEKEALQPSAIAAVAVARGLGFLAKKRFVEALKSFLELPVFTPEETALGGLAQIGAAEAYYGLADYDRAIAALEELIQSRPGAPETARAQTLLPQWKQRRAAVREAGAT